jgi:5-methylcytosine-specific restriction endonuclease McrA|tara:strand:- start:698 stop:1033 length:336 start_codon:yes stop_codon:yes gene_type:complete
MSKKQDKIKRELNKIYKEILLENNTCTGCGQNGYAVPLSFSHIIPRSRRRDLITDKRNITLHCLSMGERKGCHEIWETNKERHTLLDYFTNLAYIKEVDEEYYYLITELNV